MGVGETEPLLIPEGDSYGSLGEGGAGRRNSSSAGEPHAAAAAKGEREFSFARPGVLPRPKEDRLKSRDESDHVTDEVFNTASHFTALMLSILGSAVLIVKASVQAEPWKIVGFSIYGACLMALFAASTLHHGLEGHEGMEKGLRIADFCAIFPLIAGVGWAFFGVIWFLTLCGIALVISAWDRLPKWIPFTMYCTMGWMGAFLALFLFPFLGWEGLALIAAGGIFYTVGGIMYHIEKPNPYPGVFGFHEIWHCMVIAGAASHYALMYFVVLNYQAPNTAAAAAAAGR